MRLRLKNIVRRTAWLTFPLTATIPLGAHAQLEEIIVTATRRETDLQTTPISVQAVTGDQLELGGMSC
jgi:outer membrane receptor protein involved in Fe transport